MSAIDPHIDALYQQPLSEFTAARAALASSLKGEDARRIKQLKKPTTTPWAVNQVFWHARPVFDRVMKAGQARRRAQIAALEGRTADVRATSEAHRDAVSAAVARAADLLREIGGHPNQDELTRTFEALSLAPEPPESPGRLTQSLKPGGFEMLAGVAPVAKPVLKAVPNVARISPKTEAREPAAAARRARAEAQRAAAEARRRDATIKKAEAAVVRARATEAAARRAWDAASDEVRKAEHALAEARRR